MTNVGIVGAGAIGLSIAWRLLERGARVTLFDRGDAGHGATWASAGLLAATAGHGGPAGSPLDTLSRLGLTKWGAFAAELERASGIDVAVRTEGTLVVAYDDDEAARLREAFDAWRDAGDHAQRWLGRDEVAAMEPSLAATVVAARFCPNDHQVDNRRLTIALVEAVRRSGGVLREHADATVDDLARPVVRTADGDHAFDVVVLAAGAWSSQIGVRAVRPLKGQMIALGDRDGTPWLRHVVFTRDAYLVPRRDGRLLVGATVEERGFDDTVTAGGVCAMLDAACRAIPSLANAPLVDTWAGLRPATHDGAPLLGRLADRVIVAAGHGRNGILLTPITAETIADLVLDDVAPDWLGAFAPQSS